MKRTTVLSYGLHKIILLYFLTHPFACLETSNVTFSSLKVAAVESCHMVVACV